MSDSPQIIEVIGPAGSGKSTLVELLSQDKRIKSAGAMPYFRNLHYLTFFTRNTLISLPFLIKLTFDGRENKLSLRDINWVVILNGWHRVIRRRTSHHPILLLDEGPIFLMAYLQLYGSPMINSPYAMQWWNQMYKLWPGILDMVIYLDAPDRTLIERIRARSKPHGVKVKPDDYAFNFLNNLRGKYNFLLEKLTCEESTLKVLRFDTQRESISQVCSEITAIL